MSNQTDNLNRAQRELKRATDAERDARKAYEATPRNTNYQAKRAWDSTKSALEAAKSQVTRCEAELNRADSSSGQARSWF
ncbi:MAG: hypothetical protein ABIR46_02035 [Candidatus Saccharimonadales bacterium]